MEQIASLLLHNAPDDLDNPSQLRRNVEDLANVRDSKMRKWMQTHVRDRVNAIKINNLSLHEVNVHRPVLAQILDDLYTVHVKPDLTSTLTETNSTTQANSESEPRPPESGRRLRRVVRRDE